VAQVVLRITGHIGGIQITLAVALHSGAEVIVTAGLVFDVPGKHDKFHEDLDREAFFHRAGIVQRPVNEGFLIHGLVISQIGKSGKPAAEKQSSYSEFAEQGCASRACGFIWATSAPRKLKTEPS